LNERTGVKQDYRVSKKKVIKGGKAKVARSHEFWKGVPSHVREKFSKTRTLEKRAVQKRHTKKTEWG